MWTVDGVDVTTVVSHPVVSPGGITHHDPYVRPGDVHAVARAGHALS